MILFLPTMIGSVSQNYIIVALFVALFSHPVTNLSTNAVESVRVIGCSIMMAYEHLGNRTNFVLGPVKALVADSERKDLSPIRDELLRIQKIIVGLRQSAGFNLKSSIIDTESLLDVGINPPEPMPKVEEIEADIKDRLNTSNNKLKEIAKKTQDLIQDTKISHEKGRLKASFDTSKLKRLTSELRSQLEGSEDYNLTQIMYINCIEVFRRAKDGCQLAAEDMHQECSNVLGSFLATLWCSPILSTVGAICPWIMNQMVDEKGSCEKLRSSVSAIRLDRFGVERNQDINAVYHNLTRQVLSLSDEKEYMGADPTSYEGSEGLPERLELSVSFNRRIQELFTEIGKLIEFISDKYKLRHALVMILLFLYELYTTFTFLIIIKNARLYLRNYLTKIRFDNTYITGQFVKLDRVKRARGEPTVLPLNGEESSRFLTTFSCTKRTDEEREVQRSSCVMVLLFMAFCLFLFYLDNIFYSILSAIRDHALIRIHEVGHHEFSVDVKGEGSMARIVRRLTSRLSSVHKLDRFSDTQKCLPNPIGTGSDFYLQFIYLVAVYIFIDQVSIYAMRLRRVTAAYFYPAKEEERIRFLHDMIVIERRSNKRAGLTDDQEPEIDESEKIFTVRDALVYIYDCISSSWCGSRCKVYLR